jgi:hypothetical protein
MMFKKAKETLEQIEEKGDRNGTIFCIIGFMVFPVFVAAVISGIKIIDYIESSYYKWDSRVGILFIPSIEYSESCYKKTSKRRAYCHVSLNYDVHYEVDSVQYTRGFYDVSESIYGNYKRLPKDVRQKYEKELRNEAESFPTIFYRIDKPTRTRLSLPTKESISINWVLGMLIIWGFLI